MVSDLLQELFQEVGRAAGRKSVKASPLPVWIMLLLLLVLGLLAPYLRTARYMRNVLLFVVGMSLDRQPLGLTGEPCGKETLAAYVQGLAACGGQSAVEGAS